MNIEDLIPLAGKVIIRKVPVSHSSVILVIQDDPDYEIFQATVLAVADDVRSRNPLITKGAKVVFSRWVGMEVGSHDIRCVEEDSILAVYVEEAA